MSYNIMKLENELLVEDLVFDSDNYVFSYHNHEDIIITKIKLYRNFDYDIRIEIEGKTNLTEDKYIHSFFNKEIKFLLRNKSIDECYTICCIINRRSTTVNTKGRLFNLYGYVTSMDFFNEYSRNIDLTQEWYLYNSSVKPYPYDTTKYNIEDNCLVKIRENYSYNEDYFNSKSRIKFDLTSLKFSSKDIKELKKQSKSFCANNLLLSFNQYKFYLESICNENDEKFLIIEYNERFSIPDKIRNKIYYLFSFLFGSNLIKISEKEYNNNYQLFHERVLIPPIHNINFSLKKPVSPIDFRFKKNIFLKTFYEMSLIYSKNEYDFLDNVFSEYLYISSLELKPEIVMLDALFDMIVKGYCYYILKINQIFDDENYYIHHKNDCIKKFTQKVQINDHKINKTIKNIRNSVTHGDFHVTNDDLIKARFYYRTLINESILKILGYNGDFIDYSEMFEVSKV